jgi:ATP-binding protein involved in chromosome partitioning
MNKNEIKEILANINYPGFNRDIVSFGMVSGIEVKSDEVKIILSITSQNDEKKNILVSDIEKKIK